MHVMNRFLTRACAAAAAGVALSTVAVTGASASGGGGVPARPGALGPAGLIAGHAEALWPASNTHAFGRTAAAVTSNRTFAGYQTAVRAGSATVATATFTVPTLTCTTADRAIAADVGVLVNNYKTASLAGVITGCANGTAVYYPSVVVNGTETDYTTTPIAAGDVITVTAKVSVNRTRVQVTDVTTGVTQKIIGAGARASAAFIGNDALFTSSGALLHVPDFGKLTFKNCLVDGQALANWRPYAIQRVNSLGKVQIATGGMWPGGTAFSTHFQHS